MRLSHFSAQPMKFDPARTYLAPLDEGTLWSKPHGLWLSDETEHGWQKWCEAEKWNLDGFKHRLDFECDTSRWLVLNTQRKVVAFTDKYGRLDLGRYMADWAPVQAEYGGILISPYQWGLRLSDKAPWYYPWDCASACVWDLSTVELVREAVSA